MKKSEREIVFDTYIDPGGNSHQVREIKNVSFYPEEQHFVVRLHYDKEFSFCLDGLDNLITRSTAQLTDIDGKGYRINNLTITVKSINNKFACAFYVFELSNNKKAEIISRPFIL